MKFITKIALILMVFAQISYTSIAQAQPNPVINEFVFNHTGADNSEYVEVFASPDTDLSDYTIIVIEGDGGGAGIVDVVLPVGTTDAQGFWVSAFNANLFENGTQSVLLVRGFSGTQGDDLDTTNSGNPETMPWEEIADAFAILDDDAGDIVYASPVFEENFDGLSPFVPGGASRFIDGRDSDDVGDWFRNSFNLAGINAEAEAVAGEALNTPGAPNEVLPLALESIVINEIRVDQPSVDNDEYFELKGTGRAALDDLTYVVIGDGGGALSSGVIEAVVDLEGQIVPGNGIFLATESTFTLDFPSFITDLNFENNDNVTHLLVRGFSGENGQDLDTDNDGTLDMMPWTEVVSDIALVDPTDLSGELVYSDNQIGSDGSSVPQHVWLSLSGTFRIGPAEFLSQDTPGRENTPTTDEATFILVNADTEEDLFPINDGDEISINELPTASLNIRVEFASGEFQSVEMALDGPLSQLQIENDDPYAIFGNPTLDNFRGKMFPRGDYILQATTFSEGDAQGEVGLTASVRFSVDFTPLVEELLLIDAAADTVLQTLADGDVINLADLANNDLSILAITNPDLIGSARFELSGPIEFTNTENIGPYSLFANLGEDFFGQALVEGDYELRVLTFFGMNEEEFGSITEINFSVVNESTESETQTNAESAELSMFPNPANHQVNIQTERVASQLRLKDLSGKTVQVQEVSDQNEVSAFSLDQVKSGIYLLEIWQAGELKAIRRLSVTKE